MKVTLMLCANDESADICFVENDSVSFSLNVGIDDFYGIADIFSRIARESREKNAKKDTDDQKDGVGKSISTRYH